MPLKLKVIFTKKYDFLFARVWFHGLWGIKCNSLLTESLCRIKIYYSNVEFVKIDQALLKGVEIELSQRAFMPNNVPSKEITLMSIVKLAIHFFIGGHKSV